MLPKDLSKWEAWSEFENSYEEAALKELKSRISEVKPEFLSELINEEILSPQFGAQLTKDLLPAIKSPIQRLEFIQNTLSTLDMWPDSWGETWHIEYLELMWAALEIIKAEDFPSQLLKKTLNNWLEDWNFVEVPVVITAILSIQSINSQIAHLVATKFLDCWKIPQITNIAITGTWKIGKTVRATADFEHVNDIKYQWLADGVPITGATTPSLKLLEEYAGKSISIEISGDRDLPELVEPNPLDLSSWSLDLLSPMIAILALLPATSDENRQKLLRISLSEEYSSYSYSFWEHVCAYLTTDRENGYWDPSLIWRLGFFMALPEDLPRLDSATTFSCLSFYWENLQSLSSLSADSDSTLDRRIAKLLMGNEFGSADLKKEIKAYLK